MTGSNMLQEGRRVPGSPTPLTSFLRPNHAEFEIDEKPALVIAHMQRGFGAESLFLPRERRPLAEAAVRASGVVESCRALVDAFRANGLPVIFLQAIPNPIGKLPAYGGLFQKMSEPIEDDTPGPYPAFRPFFTDEHMRRGLEVMPEMGYVEGQGSDYVLYHWAVHAFTNSGLDLVLKKEKCQTIVWGGIPLNGIVYASSIVAGDLWYSGIIPVDASSVTAPPWIPGYHDGLHDVVAEAMVRGMATQYNQVTDTATVVEKLSRYSAAAAIPARATSGDR
ncbi:MAG TPA: isochorismatase family protein [Baekduia sp.]|nr:isochorismatase family protein [Baekduia sp.]